MRRFVLAGSLFLVLIVPGLLETAAAQSGQDPMITGILAFREGRFPDAVDAFEEALGADGENAEAHFLLARIFFETDLKDNKKAGRELDRALDLEPENVQYLTARMQQLRTDSRNFLTDKIRESRRSDLARTILKLDSTNAFAHEELGTAYIRDFWRYRNALMYPTVQFNKYEYRSRQTVDPLAGALVDQLNEAQNQFQNTDNIGPQAGAESSTLLASINPESIFLADNFDIETLEAQGIPVVDFSGRAQRAYERAVGHLFQALETDPRHRGVYDRLMEIYSLKGEWSDALEMLQQMYVYFPEDPALWTYLGMAHYRFGNLDAAAKAFESSFSGMEQGVLNAYTDIEFMMPEDEKRAYREDPTGYSTRYWTSKDPRYLTPYNERKLEHYARLTYADLLYSSKDLDLRGWETERGSILVRYGLPNGDVVIIPKSTSGIQRGAPGETGISSTDPTQGASSLALQVGRSGTSMSMADEANTFNIWDYGDFRFVFEDPFRNGEFRMYSPSAAELAQGAVPWINDYTIKAAETFREIPDRFIYEPPGRQVDLPYLVSAFKGSTGRTDLFVTYGIPILEFQDQDMINVTANAGTFVISENRDILAERRRTIYGLRTDQIVTFEDANLWIDSEQVSIPPGNVDVSVEFETTSGGTVAVQRRAVEVPDFDHDELAVSDILLAYRIEETEDGRPLAGSDLVRNGLSILPAPWSVFSRERPIYLYFEVYNLDVSGDGRASYEVEAALVPKKKGSAVGRFFSGLFGGGNDGGVSVKLPTSVAATDDGQYLILDAANQEAGLFVLTLRVKDLKTGKQVTEVRELFLE